MTLTRLAPAKLLLSVVFVLFLWGASGANASSPLRYIDFDGDGFDDNTSDADLDGIPDEIEFHSFFSMQHELILTVARMNITDLPTSEPKPPAAERFGTKEFLIRGLAQTRSDFDSGFGSDLGLGGGAGGGGVCAGGVCH